MHAMWHKVLKTSPSRASQASRNLALMSSGSSSNDGLFYVLDFLTGLYADWIGLAAGELVNHFSKGAFSTPIGTYHCFDSAFQRVTRDFVWVFRLMVL